MSLFSNTYIETQLVPYEKTVHEHRAPTDESVRLLQEMEEAALKRILNTLHLDLNSFNADLTIYSSPSDYNFKIIIQYDFNGIQKSFTHTLSKIKVRSSFTKLESVADELVNEFARHLSETILAGLSQKITQEFKKIGL